MKGQTFCYVLNPNSVQKERIVIKGDPFWREFLPKSSLVSRGATAFEIFWRGVSPVEAVLGESHTSGPRMDRSDVFDIAD